MQQRGKFFVIEGPDASGKQTQQRLLVERMTASNIPVVTVSFPQYESSFFGEMVGKMLNGDYGSLDASENSIDPHLASLVFAADRWKASSFIQAQLIFGNNVVADRYVLSNMAHQSARMPEDRRNELITFLEDLEFTSRGFEIPKPDLYIHLSVPVEITQRLLLERDAKAYLNGARKDLLEANTQHQIEAAKMYHRLSKTLPGVVTVECSDGKNGLLEREVIHELVWQQAQRVLSSEIAEGKISGERQR